MGAGVWLRGKRIGGASPARASSPANAEGDAVGSSSGRCAPRGAVLASAMAPLRIWTSCAASVLLGRRLQSEDRDLPFRLLLVVGVVRERLDGASPPEGLL